MPRSPNPPPSRSLSPIPRPAGIELHCQFSPRVVIDHAFTALDFLRTPRIFENWFFKKRRLEAGAQPLTTLDKLNKVQIALALALLLPYSVFDLQFVVVAAIQCLKRKRLYEPLIEQLGNFQLQILGQMIMLEAAEAATETVDALRTGAAAMEAMYVLRLKLKATEMVQWNDELEAELEELEGAVLEEQLLPPAEAASAVPFFEPAGLLPAPPVPEGTAREDEPEGTELEEQLLLPAATASAAPVHVIAGLLPAPPGRPGTDKYDETC
ncbi:hypothetical protein NL676_035804 [Syzygium grande]|nr:hypothetical protein NL676_035804 [Syzygium grande]